MTGLGLKLCYKTLKHTFNWTLDNSISIGSFKLLDQMGVKDNDLKIFCDTHGETELLEFDIRLSKPVTEREIY